MEDDFSNKAVWKKQVSQDGREYYVNLISGTIKYPPKQIEKKIDTEIKKNNNNSDEHYIQQYTVDKVPFFVNMKSGISSWTLPEGTPLTAVKYITHLTPEGIPYYEDTEKKTTSWTLPVEKLSSSARRSSVALVKMNRRQSNVFMAAAVQEQLDNSPTTPTNNSGQDNDGIGNGSDGEGGRSGGDSGLFKPRPRNRANSRVGAAKSGAQPRRYSNMAQKSRQNRSNSPPPEKGIAGSPDNRSIRATQRQQSISKINGSDAIDGLAVVTNGPANFSIEDGQPTTTSATRKPFTHEPQRDSPTISDVSSVTAPSHNPTNTTHQQSQPLPTEQTVPSSHFGETKPLVRQVFEKYEKNKCGWISLSNLQELCYDFGTYLSADELNLAMSEIDMDRDGRLTYEEFMVWWRTNAQFSTMKLSDAHTKLRTDCAAVYKRYDREMKGQVSRQEFAKIHRELVREKLVKLDLDSCICILDAKGDGIVYFNVFISWVERGQQSQNVSKANGSTEPPKQKSLAKFFGSFLGGGGQETETKTTQNPNLVPVKEHSDYSKYFRMVSVGGNIMDVRKQMREAGLDENLIHTPEKLISSQTKLIQNDHLAQATIKKGESAAFGSYSDTVDVNNDDSNSVHVDDKAFTSLFKKKKQTDTDTTAAPAATKASTPLVEVYLSKPLGITLGENVEDEENGVHVSSCAAGGNAANTGLIEPGMLLLEACGQDVRFKDFDSVMDILRSAPAGEKIKLIFARPGSDTATAATPAAANSDVNDQGDSDVSETSSVDKSIVPDNQSNSKSKVEPIAVGVGVAGEINSSLEPDDSDVSETSSVDRSVVRGNVSDNNKQKIRAALEPNDTDVSETSSMEHSVVERKYHSITPAEALRNPSPTNQERRDSIKSVSSVASAASHQSHQSQSTHHSISSRASSKRPQHEGQKNAELAHGNNFPKEEKTEIPSSSSSASLSNTTPKSLPTRTSFAARKAAAIRNAAARKRGNNTSSTQKDADTNAQSNFPTDDDVDVDEDEEFDSHADNCIGSTPAVPTGIFGIGNSYDSDPDADDTPPSLHTNQLLHQNFQQDNGDHDDDDDDDDDDDAHDPKKFQTNVDDHDEGHGGDEDGDEDGNDNDEAEVEWRHQEQVVAISNPQSTSTSSNQALAELENSQIIGRPRAPRKNLPSILNRMKRQKSGDSIPERGGIARMSSKPIEEVTPSLIPPESRSSPTLITNNPLSMSDIGTTGSGKVPIPLGLLEKSHPLPASNNSDRSNQSFHQTRVDDASIGSRNSEKNLKNEPIMQENNQQKPSLKEESEAIQPQRESRNRRATPLGRSFRAMRSIASKQQQQQQQRSPQQPITAEKFEHLSIPGNEQLISKSKLTPPPQLAAKTRREELLIQGRDSDSDSSTFSPKLIHKTIGNWNNSPPSIPKLGSNHSNSRDMSNYNPYATVNSSSNANANDPQRTEVSESELSHLSSSRSSLNNNSQRQQTTRQVPFKVKTVDVGVQSDYAAYIDEQYLNSYQMLLGERQQLDYMQEMFRIECEERLDMLREEELSQIERMRAREAESYQRIRNEEDRLTARVHEMEDIIMNEKEEIVRQWQDLHQAEVEAHENHRQKTSELLELMHIVRAHHDKLHADKKKIGRQRLQLDMALQDLNKFNHFNPHALTPELKTSFSSSSSSANPQRRGFSPNQTYSPGMTISSSGRRAMSPSPFTSSHSNHGWNGHQSSPSRAPSRERSFGHTTR